MHGATWWFSKSVSLTEIEIVLAHRQKATKQVIITGFCLFLSLGFLLTVNEIIGRDMSQSPRAHGPPSAHNQS